MTNNLAPPRPPAPARLARLAHLAGLTFGLTCSAAAVAQTTYWLGRMQGTNYVFDVPVTAGFAEPLLAANPAQYLVEKNPRELPRGPVPFAKATITYDAPMFQRGSVAIERKGQEVPMLWIHDQLKGPDAQPLLSQLPVPAAGQWDKATLLLAIAPDPKPLNLSVPVPPALLAQLRMKQLAQQTRPGRYYPNVKVPADLDGYRQQMLIYGNVGRRDPEFRKANGSKTVLDLSRDTQDTYADQTKTRKIQEQVFRVNKTPPYFTDHVLEAKLNEAAQFQAEYNASIENVTHDGPRAYTDPVTRKSADMSDLGKRAAYFGVQSVVEGAGANVPGGAPHNWMSSDTHFRPFFNVGGCHDQIGYGAAQGASGKWYFIMVPKADRDPSCVKGGGAAAAAPAPAPAPSPVAAAPAAPQARPAAPAPPPVQTPAPAPAPAAAAGGDFPLRAGTKLEQGRKYRTASGHTLVFQPDANLVVYNPQGGYVWGLDRLPNFRQIKTVELQPDGNLVARGAGGAFIWSALSRDPDPSATLTIAPSGALQLVSGRTGATMWSSDGRTAPAPAPAAAAATGAAPILEVGKQYALPDKAGNFRYLKLMRIHTSSDSHRYLFGACPNPPANGVQLDPSLVMRVDDAVAQGLKQALGPCDVNQVPFGR